MAEALGKFDAGAVGAILREVAAAEILPRFRNLARENIRSKAHEGDLVTIADLAAERELQHRLTALLPGSVTLGEEAVYQNPDVKVCVEGDSPVWIIDPVDGTANFASGDEHFAVIVALAYRRRTVAGWILDPVNDRLYSAERGAGVWCEGRRLGLKERAAGPLSGLRGSLGKRLAERYGAVLSLVPHRGSAAHDYIALVEGRLDYRLFRLLNPWDHAAGVLMAEEAGAYARLLSRNPYAPVFLPPDALMIAPDRAAWEDLKAILEL